jgi:hypothetical protein
VRPRFSRRQRMSILTAVGPGLHSEEGLEADQAFQGLTELSTDPTRHTQVRGRGVYSYKAGLRGLELGNVGFLKSRPNCLVFQNIFVLETFRRRGSPAVVIARATPGSLHLKPFGLEPHRQNPRPINFGNPLTSSPTASASLRRLKRPTIRERPAAASPLPCCCADSSRHLFRPNQLSHRAKLSARVSSSARRSRAAVSSPAQKGRSVAGVHL